MLHLKAAIPVCFTPDGLVGLPYRGAHFFVGPVNTVCRWQDPAWLHGVRWAIGLQ
jgi:hypothetical protein